MPTMITNTIIARLSEKRKFIQIIIGPRQVCKSTAMGERYMDKSEFALQFCPYCDILSLCLKEI